MKDMMFSILSPGYQTSAADVLKEDWQPEYWKI